MRENPHGKMKKVIPKRDFANSHRKISKGISQILRKFSSQFYNYNNSPKKMKIIKQIENRVSNW